MAYPPAIRILRLLRDEGHLTKFDIGRRLGFVGEKGFTTFDQSLLVCELALEADPVERNRMRSNWEGTADKYARDIAGWMEGSALGWIRQVPKTVGATEGKQTYQAEISHAYVITGAGLEALRRAEGESSNKRTDKNVIYEMLATKAPGREYLRRRRALTLKVLEDGQAHTLDQMHQTLNQQKLEASTAVIENDLSNFINLGLRVESEHRKGEIAYRLLDNIKNLFFPQPKAEAVSPQAVQEIKNRLLEKLEYVDKRYLVLLDLSVDPAGSAADSPNASGQKRTPKKKYTQFEIDTVALLRHCGFDGVHLGGGDKPDGGIYSKGCTKNYGLILDAKSRSKGFACEDSERDKMTRYFNENLLRLLPHKNQWWKVFDTSPESLVTFFFLFVSSSFVGKYRDQFVHLSQYANGALGAGISAENLLLFAEEVRSGRLSLEEGRRVFSVMRAVEPPDFSG